MRYVSLFPVIRRVKIFPHSRPRAENFPFSFQKNEPQNRPILTFFRLYECHYSRKTSKRLKTAFLDFYRDLAQKQIFLPRKIASPHRFLPIPIPPDSDTGRGGKILTCSASFYVPPRENVPYGTIANAFPVLICGVDFFVSLTRYIFPFSRKTFIPSASPRKIIYCNPPRIFVDE